MPRKGENIYKRKDGRWEGRYCKSRNENGKIKYGYVYAKTYTDVKNKLEQAKKNHTISLEKSGTNIINLHLVPFFREQAVHDITLQEMEDYKTFRKWWMLLREMGRCHEGI